MQNLKREGDMEERLKESDLPCEVIYDGQPATAERFSKKGDKVLITQWPYRFWTYWARVSKAKK